MKDLGSKINEESLRKIPYITASGCHIHTHIHTTCTHTHLYGRTHITPIVSHTHPKESFQVRLKIDTSVMLYKRIKDRRIKKQNQ